MATNMVQDSQLLENPLYRRRLEQVAKDKPLDRRNPLGAVAASRFPGSDSRREIVEGIRAQDRDLVDGQFGTIRYRSITVRGIELKLEPIQPSLGTIVHGIDLATDLDDPEMVSFIRQLWLDRRVIAFRNQGHLSRQQLVEYAEKFGEVGAQFGEREHVPNSPFDLNQQVTDPNIPDLLILPSDEHVPNAASGWHADATWQPRPPMASVLICREAPPVGGDTGFCDCYSMWEGLPDDVKRRVENLKAVHIGNVGHQMDRKTPVSVHPVARTHPETGRTTLYVQQGFVKRFAPEHNIPEEAERDLLLRMKFQEGRLEYTCRLKWETGTLAMWDNRAVLHSASADFWPHRRLMERLTILDRDESRRTPYYNPQTEAL